MNPWIIIVLIAAGIVFVIDRLLRKKKWEDNSKEEGISLLVNMFTSGPYVFLSAIGMMLGIVANSPKTFFGKVLNEVTLTMASTYFVVAIVALVLSLVFRKKGKIKASIWVNIIALVYIVAVMVVNSLVGKIF